MRKVKNKRIILHIADRTRKAAKGKNLIAVLAIALTALLFTSVFTVGGSLVAKQQETTMRQVGGSSHAGYKLLTEKEYDIVKKDKKIKEISYRILVGNAVNDSLKKLHTEVSYYEDLDATLSFCYPEKGHMPEGENEIVTSDLVLKALNIPCRLGEKVTLSIDINGKVQEKNFILSGYFKGDTISQAQVVAVSKKYANRVAPTPLDSAMNTQIDASDYAGRIVADFNFATSFQLEKQVAALTERCGFPETADVGVNWAYMAMNIDLETAAILGLLLFIILISGYLIIYNIFYINVFRDIQHYGLLKTIGTTGRQLGKMVRRQALVLSLYGIPLGLVCGAVVGKLILPAVVNQLNFSGTTDTSVSLNPWIFVGSAVFSLITVYISCIKPCRIAAKVTPIEAVRFTEGKQYKKKKKTGKVSPRKMAFQNMKRNKKKVVIVIASLSLALVLLNSVYSLVSGFDMDKFIASQTLSDFSVADATLDNVSVSYRVLDGVTVDLQKELERQEGVTEVGNVYLRQPGGFKLTNQDYKIVEKRILDNPRAAERIQMITKESADPQIRQVKDSKIIGANIYGVGKMVMEKLEKPEGQLDWEKFQSGKYVITGRFWADEGNEGIDFFKPGEKVTISNDQGKSKQYEVLAVANMPYACGLQAFGFIECNYILPEKEYLHFMGSQQPMRTLFNVESGSEKKVEQWMSNYCENVNDDLTYTSKAKIVEQFESMKDMYVMVGGLLAFILAFIGILNFINTMVTSVLSRKQEFAMMEAVGMTGSQLKQMLYTEGLYYAILTGVLSVVAGGMINSTAIRSIGEGYFFFTWNFTVTPILLCIPALLLVVIAVPWFCYGNMHKISVVERLRQL